MTTETVPTAATEPLRYDPSELEPRWMQRWLDDGVFHAEVHPGADSYSIVVPPPNVTGALHMGHALNGSVQDALVRLNRMRGKDVLWMPGTDHAGIATQNVVEKQLRAEGLTRHDLGREAFLERVRTWKDQYGATIIGQFQRLGASMDYERERFTMDDAYARAVLDVFVHLFDKGWVYRADRLVNWCGECGTAVSDLEVVNLERDDEMYELDYPLVDGGGHLTVATVRPETVVADVAVAVHPDDERYRHLVGTRVRVPLTRREVPVIADEHVDPAFGTGVLKITPGHDPNDFAIGERHQLEVLSAIAPDLTMTELAGDFAGMPVAEAKVAMVEAIDQAGLLRSREPYRHSVPHCERSGTRIEPLVSLQWFCDMTELAKPANAAVASGEVRFTPEGAVRIFRSWMDDLKPWCLSRQLWWGHQLPVWYCDGEDHHVHVSVEGPGAAACPDCDAATWTRDPDVLDTWFSSGLWSFATMGWPDDTPELRQFHPTDVLCTARDIINLWVARMMMFSYELLGEKPFSDVYIHSVVQAPDGKRMSKSKGTGIDPLVLIDQHGADATRYGLLAMSSTQDVRFNEGKIREGRDLANKLWNAVRLLVTLGDADALLGPEGVRPDEHLGSDAPLEDRWIASRADAVAVEVAAAIDAFDFARAAKSLYSFVWSELCDWYLEAVKPRLRSDDAAERATASRVLGWVLDRALRLVHPVMPHVTEELAEQLHGPDRTLLALSAWPEPTGGHDVVAEAGFAQVQRVVAQLRSLRSAADVPPGARIAASLQVEQASPLAASAGVVAGLARLTWDEAVAGASDGVDLPVEGGRLTVAGLDPAVLRTRLAKDLDTARADQARAEKKLANPKFVAGAADEVVQGERDKVATNAARAVELEAVLAQLG